MDNRSFKDDVFVIDLESGSHEEKDSTKLCDQLMNVGDNLANLRIDEYTIKVVIDSKFEGEKVVDVMGNKEKRKKGSSSAKKPPKPPRPPRGFSLDAADQKLIKELAELAMMKRARIERMKVLKQKKALKASSSSSSMSGSLFATLFTVIFFLMMFLQGMSCRSPVVAPQGSPQTAQTNDNGLVFIQEQLNPSASNSILPHSKSSNLFEKISGSGSASRSRVAK